MITARRLNSEIKVPVSAYERVFKRLGYEVVHNDSEEMHTEVEHTEYTHEAETNKTEETDIPLSKMNPKQLRTFANEKGIDISGTKSFAEAKEVVKKAISEM